MKKQTTLMRLAIGLFAAATALFLIFFLFVDQFEEIDVFRSRGNRTYAAVEDYALERVEDAAAPAGVRYVYRWTQQVEPHNDTCLTILTYHQAVEVYFDGELVYSMTPSADNRLADSTGTYWSTVPLYATDAGAEVTAVITPLYADVADYGAEFWHGSQFSALFDSLRGELSQLLISMLCIVLGVFIILVQLYFSLVANTHAWDMFFLGSFAVLLGLWRTTYANSITVLFPEDPMAMSYINIGALFLVSIPLSLYAATFVKKNRPLLILSCVCSLVNILVAVLQLLGVKQLREMLTVSHVLLVVTILAIFLSLLLERFARKQRKKGLDPFVLIGVGVLLDILSFNLDKTSSSAMFTLLAFILYALITFITRATAVSRGAYTDSRTGLGNRLRWNELMDAAPPTASYALLVMDLNGLKQVNDTLGHEAGDRMIFRFANILRNTLPGSGVICRWGGDEFTALLTDITREQLDGYVQALHRATGEHNAQHPDLPIHFAAGTALSTEHPDMTRTQLFQRADEEMYENKRLWYSQRSKA